MHAPDDSDPKRQRKRARDRRYRERQPGGILSVTLDVTPADTDKLERLEYLAKHELEDRPQIAAAISRLLDRIGLKTTENDASLLDAATCVLSCGHEQRTCTGPEGHPTRR